MDYDDIFSSIQGRGRPAKHPYAKMAVGDIVDITGDVHRMQTYAHVYGRSSGKKFATRKVDGILYVKRTE